MAGLRMLAVSATAKRIGYVFLIGNRLMDWRVAARPARSRVGAAGWLQELINSFRPDVVVTEQVDAIVRKGARARDLIAALQRIASENYVLDVAIRRVQRFASKYEEAASLAKLYPSIKAWLPKKRRAYETEPHRMVTFEALSLAHAVLERPTTALAAAMS